MINLEKNKEKIPCATFRFLAKDFGEAIKIVERCHRAGKMCSLHVGCRATAVVEIYRGSKKWLNSVGHPYTTEE